VDHRRSLISAGANTKKSAAITGTSANSRKSRMRNKRPMPTHAPTHAFRLSVVASATSSAGMTSDGHMRSRR
jgi:hypothetical protein